MPGKLNLILISGWAHTAADLEDLRKRIESSYQNQLFCQHSDSSKVGRDSLSRRSSTAQTDGQGCPSLPLKTFTDIKAIALATADLWNEPRDNEPPSVYARNLKALIEKSGGQSFLAGWSLGGMIALEAAHNWPELIKGLILISSTPKFCLGPGWATGTPAGAIRAMLTGLKQDPHAVFKSFFANVTALSKDAEVAVTAKAAFAAAMNSRELIYGLEYLRDRDFSASLKKLTIPALIIHGRLDSIINVEAALQLNRLLALSRLRVYDAYGHGLPCQNPQAVADDISIFIAECGKPGKEIART